MKRKVNIKRLCEHADMSRQNYYKTRRQRQVEAVDTDLIASLVRAERGVQPRLGGRKLLHMIGPELKKAGVAIGRDRFFEALASRGLLLDRLPKSPRTTNSRHCLPVFRNLIKDMEVSAPNQVWVSDITYLRTEQGFVYLSLITDMYSRKIVGFDVSETLETQGCLRALEQALESLGPGCRPVHHSDRGSQYCSHSYTQRLRDLGFKISMTEENHCYENALAERVNGILKQEYFLGGTFRRKSQALSAVREAVGLYNTRRPHLALNYRVPEEVHSEAA